MIDYTCFYDFKLFKVTDGDTVVGDIHVFPAHNLVFLDQRIRLLYINAPEKTGSTKLEGLRSKEYLENLIRDKDLTIFCKSKDSFGRILGEIFYLDEDNSWYSANYKLLENGYASPYRI